MQEEGKKERVVEYASKALATSEKNYPITEMECLGVVWAVDKFSQYLGASPFTIYTDHAALITMQTHMNLTPKRTRWLAELQQYEFTIKHKKAVLDARRGKQHGCRAHCQRGRKQSEIWFHVSSRIISTTLGRSPTPLADPNALNGHLAA